MTAAAEVLAEIRALGAVAYRWDGRVRLRPGSVIPPGLLAAVRLHKAEILPLLPTVTPSEPEPNPAPWIISHEGDGGMRLVVDAEPPWPDAVFAAAALIAILDRAHREDRATPTVDEAARLLDGALAALHRDGVDAWLTS